MPEAEVMHMHFQRATWLEYGEDSIKAHRAAITWLHSINAEVSEGNLIEHVYCDKTELEHLLIPKKIFLLDTTGLASLLKQAGFDYKKPSFKEVNEDFRAKLLRGENVHGKQY